VVERVDRMSGFKKLGSKGNVVHRVVLPGPTRRAGARGTGRSGASLRRPTAESEGRSPSLPAAWGRGRPAPPVNTPVDAPAPAADSAAAPRSPSEARQGQRETELLQRRIDKLSKLLTEQEEEIRSLSGARGPRRSPEFDEGADEEATPVYDLVKPGAPESPRGEKRRAFMSKLFQANLDLRESVNKSRA